MEEIDKRRTVCRNPWCKATFEYKSEETPMTCPKCNSFDTELSGGVTWTDRNYEGPRFDGMPHQISINVKKYAK
jgi:hypothetical protein